MNTTKQIANQQDTTDKETHFRGLAALRRDRLPEARAMKIAAGVQRELLDMSLKDARELAVRTQAEIAAALETTQTQISRIEARDDHLVSTIRKYIEALGGELVITANFGDKSVRLRGV
jgi:hypothetical protein